MTKTCAPSLDDLLALQNPAWLWDGDRSRIVWANRAAVDWFGCQSMFEVLDVVFSPDEPSVRELDRIAARLPRGEKVVTALSFSSAISRRAANFACHVHSLADGRTGLLVVMEGDEAVTGALDPQTGMAALMHLPSPLAVIYGSGAVMFENAALSKLFGEAPGGGLSALVNDDGFFDRFVTGAFKAGLVSGIETLETSLGERALQIVVQVLEQKSRIAGTTFLLTFEDITERRALEKSLLTVRQPASTREDARPQAADDKAAALSDIKQKIEEHTDRAAKKQARPDEAGADRVAEIKDDSPAQKAGEGDDDIDVPEIVSGTLNRLPQPIVVFNDSNGSGKILFANNVAVELFGARDWRELDEKTTLASALAALEGEDGSLSLFDLKDNVILLDVIVSTFPWKGGAVFQATLTPTTPEEEADRLLDDTLKKKPQEKDAEGRSAALNTERPAQVAASPAPEAGDSAETPEDDEARASGKLAGNELRAILDTATDGIVILDMKGRIVSFSASAEALFGLASAEVKGRRFTKLLSPASRKTVKNYLASLGEGGIASVFNDGREVEAVVAQGGTVPLFVTISRLDRPGKNSKGGGKKNAKGPAFCVVLRDITQWKKTEAELREAKEQAEKSSAQKSDFLANISHELRTPLNAILGFSEVMRSERFGGIENEKYLAYANDIHISGEYLLSLINDLLDLAKIESGKLELNFTSVNLANLIDEAIHSTSEQATRARVLLRKSIPPGLPNVVADHRSITQILLNILSNAIKFTGPGGQVITSARLDRKSRLHLTIKDTGKGMSEKEIERALKPFQQLDNQPGKTSTGTGLGLPLTKALVEANRASFEINSAPGKGTEVEIIFPTTRVLAD